MYCEFCNKEYKGKSAKYNILKHLVHCMMNPYGERYKCTKCNKEFDKRHALNGHKKNCGKEKIIKKRNRRPIKTNCKFCGYEELNPLKLGSHVSWCKSNPNYENRINKLSKIGRNRRHSEETKNKISKRRVEYLSNNPDRVPYLLNHSSKESYPEKYFTELFENENIEVKKDLQIGLYELDFYIEDKKIDIEIDGEQHYCDPKILDSDKRRTKFLEERGCKIIRIRWANYKKLNFEEKTEFIKKLKEEIQMTPYP